MSEKVIHRQINHRTNTTIIAMKESIDLKAILSRYCTPSPELLAAFTRYARPAFIEKGHPIAEQANPCKDFVFIKSGLVRIACKFADGKEDTIAFGTTGDTYTSLHSYYAGEPSAFSLMAVEDTEVWLVSYDAFNRMSAQYPELVLWLRNLLVEQLFALENKYVNFANKSAEERFCNFLNLSFIKLRNVPVKYLSRVVPLKYIAQYLDITSETLSRLRRKLVKSDKNGE